MCSKSLKYTVIAEVKSAIPRHKIYSTNIIKGKYTIEILNPKPDIRSTANITIKEKSIFTNELVTNETGRTSLGKYIFFTKSFCEITAIDPDVRELEKNIQGISPTKINI
jgi:Zn-finger domain-containing protein